MIIIKIGKGRLPKARKKPPFQAPTQETKDKISDMRFRAMLQECSDLRKELGLHLQMQNTIIALITTTSGVLVTIGLNLHSKPLDERLQEIIFLIFCTIIPGVVAFLGMLWLWQVHRSKKMETYISIREKRLNTLVEAENNKDGSALYWEQWNYQQSSGKGFFDKVNSYQSYMCAAMFLILPIISFLVGIFLTNDAFFSAWRELSITIESTHFSVTTFSSELVAFFVLSVVGAIFYSCFLFFFLRYVREFKALDIKGFGSTK